MPTRGTEYPSLRQHLNQDFAEWSDAQIESYFERRNIDAESMEGFFSDLGKFASSAGQTLLKAAPSVLPIAGQVVGTAFGGPLGAGIGGALGSLAGKAVGAAAGQKIPGGVGGAITGALGGALGGLKLPIPGGSAAGQLFQTLLNPQTLNAVASMGMGALGKPNVSVGGSPVPLTAFTNLLGVLAGRAEAEYNEAIASTRGNAPKYMQDYAGEAKGDPAIPEARAEALYELLEFESEQESAESAESGEAASEYESEMEAIQAEWEAMELAELYEIEAFESEEL